MDCFSWSHSDMIGIPQEVMTHKLNEDPSYPPVKQNKRKQGTFKNQMIQEEVQKLLEVGSIREVKYPNWLANTLVVPKKNGKWRVCVDYTDLNKAYPKDSFPLPHIDQLIDATTGKFLGFLVSNRGIKVNPTQIKAIEEIPDILSNKKEALRNLKKYLSNPPLLAKPKAEEKLLIYLAVSEVVVSAVLVREEQGRLAKWAIELSEYEIAYQPRTAIKSQVLADFVADFSQGMQLEAEKELHMFNGANPGTWTLFTDGSSNVKRAAREARMQKYLEKVRELIKQFENWKVRQIPRDENLEADALANLASVDDVENDANASAIHVFHSVLDPDVNFNNLTWNWRNEIIAFLQYGTVPNNKKKAYVLRRKAARYCLKQVGNGQAESTNKVIINNLKKRLEESKGNWPEVLPSVLWAYRTTTKTSMGETPFSLVYGTEALIPVEIGESSTRFTHATQEFNDKEMRVNLDLLKARRETALIRMTAQK
ncbi:uncharacterized protein [Nicotiana sylvestris]|uniref:uncharacterized protein n=1 Tax=Nicotiana sylvestris TaxID=4096 RepID=UPI00388CA491